MQLDPSDRSSKPPEPPLDRFARWMAGNISRREAARMFLAATAAVASLDCGAIIEPSTCGPGQCRGNDNRCYGPCSQGNCTTSPSGNCSAPNAGVYCCAGGSSGGGSCHCNPGNTYNFLTGICCPNTSPYYYPGTHGGSKGCYTSCPYIGDCGSQWQRC